MASVHDAHIVLTVPDSAETNAPSPADVKVPEAPAAPATTSIPEAGPTLSNPPTTATASEAAAPAAPAPTTTEATAEVKKEDTPVIPVVPAPAT